MCLILCLRSESIRPFWYQNYFRDFRVPPVVLLFLQRNHWILDSCLLWAAPHVRLVTAGWTAYAYFNPNGLKAIGDGMQCLCHFTPRPNWNQRVPWGGGQLGRSLFGQFQKLSKSSYSFGVRSGTSGATLCFAVVGISIFNLPRAPRAVANDCMSGFDNNWN